MPISWNNKSKRSATISIYYNFYLLQRSIQSSDTNSFPGISMIPIPTVMDFEIICFYTVLLA